MCTAVDNQLFLTNQSNLEGVSESSIRDYVVGGNSVHYFSFSCPPSKSILTSFVSLISAYSSCSPNVWTVRCIFCYHSFFFFPLFFFFFFFKKKNINKENDWRYYTLLAIAKIVLLCLWKC